jgi:hypothetical protein
LPAGQLPGLTIGPFNVKQGRRNDATKRSFYGEKPIEGFFNTIRPFDFWGVNGELWPSSTHYDGWWDLSLINDGNERIGWAFAAVIAVWAAASLFALF